MSHTSSVKSIAITNVEALRAAVTELNSLGVSCELLENASPRAYFSNQAGLGQADFVLKLHKSRYDVGFYRTEQGGYEVRTDFWGQDVKNQLGAKASGPGKAEQAQLGKLFQAYGIHAAMGEARRRGLQATRQKGADGVEQVVVTGYR
jgi:hypothetical protein